MTETSGTWTSAETSPAKYEVYGGTWPNTAGISANGLDNRDDMWHSAIVSGDRGVKVTFEESVNITRFEGSYFQFVLIFCSNYMIRKYDFRRLQIAFGP